MAFDMGWHMRGTANYVTDPAYGVPLLAEAYPHTYSNGNGDSINAGYSAGTVYNVDLTTSLDVRLAGVNYVASGDTANFTVDLSSGSAPGAADYDVDLAFGRSDSARTGTVTVKDNTTTRLTFSGTTGGAAHYFDATGTDRDASGGGSWESVGATTVTATFASTTAHLIFTNIGDTPFMAHFRLTKQEAGGTNTDITPPSALRLG